MKRNHLTKSAQFIAVYRGGKSQVNDLLVMKAIPNGEDFTRYGLTVSKRVGNAVVRNRVKRQLREILRLRLMEVQRGWDVVFISRPAAAVASYIQLKQSVTGLFRRAKMMEPESDKKHE